MHSNGPQTLRGLLDPVRTASGSYRGPAGRQEGPVADMEVLWWSQGTLRLTNGASIVTGSYLTDTTDPLAVTRGPLTEMGGQLVVTGLPTREALECRQDL